MNIDSGFIKLNIGVLKTVVLLLLFFILFTPYRAISQNIMGARGIGIAGAVTALPNYEWSIFQNPAMMPAENSHVSFFAIRY
ncbi:MAG: hypothetical protein WD491_12975, partial [Balneolales bacterium]